MAKRTDLIVGLDIGTTKIAAIVGEARGVTKGSEVWLGGQKIGRITDIQFRSPASAGGDAIASNHSPICPRSGGSLEARFLQAPAKFTIEHKG